jgi:hypothetical protein
VLELINDDTALVEITSIPELDIERIIFPPLAKLRHIRSHRASPKMSPPEIVAGPRAV